VNAVFATSAFWRPYLTLEPGEFSENDFAAQIDGLRTDFTVRDGTVHFEYSGRQHTVVHRTVEFPFCCGEQFSLVIEYEPDVSGGSKTLLLVDASSGTKSQMGWWDLARWHPYCLRLAELDLLLQFWRHSDHRWRSEEVPLLLLCQFVGLPDSGARDALAARAQTALRSLGLPGANEGQLDVPLRTPDGDYRWEADAEFGWVFTSDEYCCYSLRNRPHSDSDEGRFPFTTFGEMMNEVRQRLDRA
jgi:hypothetical protein